MYRLFMVAVLGAGCGAGLDGQPGEQQQGLGGGEVLCPQGQSQACHDGQALCVPDAALAAHVAHGDAEGPCNPIGSPPREEPPAWMPHAPTPPQQVDEEAFDQPASALRASVSAPAWAPKAPRPPAQVAEEETSEPAPPWTPQAPTEPVPLCGAEVGDPCGGTFGGCCEGLRCAWGVCLPE